MNSRDRNLLYNKLTEPEIKSVINQYGVAYKENRLNSHQEHEYGRQMLQSPFSQDQYTGIKIFEELIRSNANNDMTNESNDLFEYYIGWIIGLMKVEDYDSALLQIDRCKDKLQLSMEQSERLNELKSLIKNRNRYKFWTVASAVAAIGALAMMVFAKK